jgi:hypothetical protein
MNEYTQSIGVVNSIAIKESNDRKARLKAALEKPALVATVADHSRKVGAELVHMETELKPHGLSVADLLRSVAKHFHGVSVPVYTALPEGEE